MIKFIIYLSLATLMSQQFVFCENSGPATEPSLIEDGIEKVYSECGTNVDCAEQKLVSLIDRVDSNENLDIFDGVKVVKKLDAKIDQEVPAGNEDLIQRAVRYLGSHELKIEAPKLIENGARALSSEPRRRKIRKILLPILLLLKVKAIIIIPIVLTVIGLVAMKGLGAALTALTISAFTALKGILDGKQTTEKRVTYGVIPPYLAHEPHWSRAGPTSLDYPELDPYYRTLPRGQ